MYVDMYVGVGGQGVGMKYLTRRCGGGGRVKGRAPGEMRSFFFFLLFFSSPSPGRMRLHAGGERVCVRHSVCIPPSTLLFCYSVSSVGLLWLDRDA